ncbi:MULTISPECIES: PIN domain-containing protein [unclassified Adlercreutzia]|uniref:type II toxin-antitoxin system VapC family toxin n=1 Tax=unclassified Adlercreutzia TaxID=2636013 RepID=UPI0013ECD5D2|nr:MULTISPECIES: PIN domain-containing protein [unclassified Adlercreutzia]
MKVLLDTNVLVDLWSDTDDFEYSYRAFDVATYLGFDVCMTALSAQTFVYLLPARKVVSRKETMRIFEKLLDYITVLDVTESDCRTACRNCSGDFEDDLNAWSAYRNGVDIIITRDKADFAKSPVAVMTPQTFVGLYQPTCLEYEMVPF